MVDKLDLILFGATGFTGKLAIPILYKLTKANGRRLSWGIAGRSRERLREVLNSYQNELGPSITEAPIIVASVEDERSLRNMARQTKLVVNCCGPYRFFGEPVVKACVEEGTHHVDISGEPQYMEEMQLKYHKLAQQKGVYVVSGCGLDSVPTDLGTVFLERNFKGTLNSVETYFEHWEEGEGAPGPLMNYATYVSAVHGVAHAKELTELRRKLFTGKLPEVRPKLKTKKLPHKEDFVEGWVCPLMGADRSVAKRSQRYFFEKEAKRPLQIETYFIIKQFDNMMLFLLSGLMISSLSGFKCGQNLLVKYPSIFTFGVFTKEQPGIEKLEKTWFSVTLYGKGWKNPEDQGSHPDTLICARVKGRNPAYGAANICLVLSAIKILTEQNKLPPGGGVFPPGYALANTSLVDELNQNDVTFEVLYEKSMSLKAKY